MQNKKLSMKRILAFASCDFFGGGAFNIVNFLYPGYVVLALGLSPYLAGIVIMIARIFDAVIDPFIGLYSDKLRVRFGTRRGSMLVSAPFIILSLFLMFYPYAHPDVTVRFLAALFSYIFFCAVQSSIMIPYYSLSSEMTEDYTERARMTSVRMGFSIFASIVCVALPGMIVSAYENNRGYIVMSLLFGAIFAVCAATTGFFAKEGVSAPEKPEPFSLKDFVKPFAVKPFRQYLWLLLTCQITMAVMSGLFFFYVDFYFCRSQTAAGSGNVVGMIGAAIMFGMQIVALPFYLAMIKRTSKMRVYIVGSAIWVIFALLLPFVPADSSPLLLYLLAAVLGFGISGPGLIPHAIFADVVDVGHLQLSSRSAGAFSGLSNFLNTVAQALGLSAVMAIIGAAGFVEQDISEGAAKILAQPLAAQRAIVWVLALAPLAFMSAGIFAASKYRLDKEKHAEVLAAIGGDERQKAAVLRSL